MKIKMMLKHIIDKGKTEDMYKLNDMLNDLICDLKEKDYDMCCKYKKDLYELAYGKTLTKEFAEDIVKKMQPYGLHWTIEQTNDVKRKYNLNDISEIDFFIVMNMAYNDYQELFEDDIEKYVKYTKMFINDKDANKDKVYNYFTSVVKEED